MKNRFLDVIDFERVNTLLEGFNQSTGFVTAILDLDGNVLSKSGWRQICTEFHRKNSEAATNCIISDTVLANSMRKGEKYHFYKCLNGLVDVAVPIVIDGEHVANLFSGQFFFEEPDISFFKRQAELYGFDENSYLKALKKVPVVSREEVKVKMNFLLSITQMITELTFEKFEQLELNEAKKQAKDEAELQAHRAKALLQVSSHLNAELELDKVYLTICEEACSALHTSKSVYLSYDSNTRCFHLSASSGLPEEQAQTIKPIRCEMIDYLIKKQGKAGIIPDLFSDSELLYANTMFIHDIQNKAYSIVERDGLPLGILIVGDEDKVDLSDDSIALLSGFANQAASAVTNAQLFKETNNRLLQVQALRNIDLAITGILDSQVTFQVVLNEIRKALKTDAVAILRLDPLTDTLKYEHWIGFNYNDITNVLIPLGQGYSGHIALEGQSIHIDDLREEESDSHLLTFITREGFAAYNAVPLIAKGAVLGVLEVFHREPIASKEEWLAFLETLAGQAAIAIDNAELFTKLERSNKEQLQAYEATIEGWAHALDLKDEETENHSRRVTELTLHIAGKMGMKEDELTHVRRGALLHDIGKMGIPDSILLKPDKLTNEEWLIMRKHPVYAFDMLSKIQYLHQALDIPYCHHEKWDGGGYPQGLKGEQIPLAARIFAVVDVYDALTSDRPYRKAWTRDKTLEHIRGLRGTHFDPHVVDVFFEEINNIS